MAPDPVPVTLGKENPVRRLKNSHRLRSLAPPETLFVSESGIKTREDIQILKENGTNAVLIGETLMRAGDKKKMLDYLAGRRENDDPD